ncbi:hypothetical protein PSYCG_09730 [Psychrobacter sp. G]|uniref:spore coat protein U domain-containing protein n=1 Tax=Psychrobacter sp. G TaxID=571800 RepID=UPI000354AADC|nr:spore coat protein U domain-containing protein [Psychrobacter sp. G]AGP49446.1 hypothetical protein PSYCG_09730 [Psychrobacter sp. G]
MLFKKSVMTAAVFAVGSFAVMTANAAEPNPATSSFGVSMEVEKICTISAAPLAVTLANTQAGKATPAVTSTTSITVNCSKGDSATISLTPASSGNLDGTGNLKGGDLKAELIPYKLTSVSANGTAWGSTGNTLTTEVATSYKTDITETIYLTVTNDADVTPGAYTDTINVSVAY